MPLIVPELMRVVVPEVLVLKPSSFPETVPAFMSVVEVAAVLNMPKELGASAVD